MLSITALVAGVLVAVSFAYEAEFGTQEEDALRPDRLRCEYLENPLGIDMARPRLSWIVRSKARAKAQSAYRILVASEPELLAKATGDLWDSGVVRSSATNQIEYAGMALRSHQACFWTVRVWDEDGKASGWSDYARWTMGLLDPANEWKAAWIGFDACRQRPEPAGREIDWKRSSWIWYPEGKATEAVPGEARYFRRDFAIPAGRRVRSAVCAVTADNEQQLYLNGEKIAESWDWRHAVLIDVTERIRSGTNVLGVRARNVNEGPAGMLCQLRIEFEDGEPLLLVSGEDWQSAKKAGQGWSGRGYSALGWKSARRAASYGDAPWGEIQFREESLFLPPVQHLRREFELGAKLTRGLLYASALGNYELRLNGEAVSDAYFLPGWTDYGRRVPYQCFDVTRLLKEGDNVLGALLADGWYSGYIGWGRKRDHYGTDPRISAQLLLEFADGSSRLVTTDAQWQASTGPTLYADFLMGEGYDARHELPGWDRRGYLANNWSPVQVDAGLAPKLGAHPGVPVQVFAKHEAQAITEPEPGVYIFDLGTNFAGFARLRVRGAEAGHKIQLRFAERLDAQGKLYTRNLRGARAMDEYICKGTDEELWQPRFTFHGFQFVELRGYPCKPGTLPPKDTITGVELTSATPVVGRFETDDAQTNRLYANICQTQRANFIEVPTDCPQRDERLGWMGDAQIYVRTATFNADVAAFFKKWLVDVEDAQSPKGAFSDVAPRIVAMGEGTAAWGDAGVWCPWVIYEVYGDRRVLEEHYDAMQAWIRYCEASCNGTLLRPARGYGDWLSIEAETPKNVLATAYFAHSTHIVALVARELGKQEDAARYQELFERIRAAFCKAYVGEDARIQGDTQTAYVLALAFDLLPEAQRAKALGHLVADIEKRGGHLSTGFVGTKDLMTTLSRFGRDDIAYRLFHNKSFPSWGFSIQHGATSIWERWDGWTPEQGFQDPGMNSFAHYSFGAVGEWMFRYVAGIDMLEPGYAKVLLQPRIVGELTRVDAQYDSIRGRIASSWRLEEGEQGRRLLLQVEIPANTKAELRLPGVSDLDIREGDAPLRESPGIDVLTATKSALVMELGSGRYRFSLPLPR
jgi:alpha-L-rhamnosidase